MSTSNPDEPTSILAHVQPFAWSDTRAIKFEVAMEIIGHTIAAYSAKIAAEETKTHPDPAAIAAWEHQQRQCAQTRRDLAGKDLAAIEAAITTYTQLAAGFEQE